MPSGVPSPVFKSTAANPMTETAIPTGPAAAKRARILLVDDHPVVRHGLAKLFESEGDMVVCGEVGSAAEAMATIPACDPSLVIVDLSLGGRPGLDLVKDLRSFHPTLAVLVLSMHDEAVWAERAVRAGAVGYVMKQERPRQLVVKVRQALRGETCLSDRMTAMLLEKAVGRKGGGGAVEDVLGDRELQVLQMIGAGMPTREIAASMNISVKTVEAHREHIKQKLGLDSAAALLRYALLRFLGDT